MTCDQQQSLETDQSSSHKIEQIDSSRSRSNGTVSKNMFGYCCSNVGDELIDTICTYYMPRVSTTGRCLVGRNDEVVEQEVEIEIHFQH